MSALGVTGHGTNRSGGVASRSHCGPRSQYLGDRPSLRNAAARGEGRIAIEDFADAAKPMDHQVVGDGFKKPHGLFRILVDAEMRQHIRAEQPSPDSSLMVRAIAVELRAAIMPTILPLILREAAKPVRSEQLARTYIHYGALLLRCKRAGSTGRCNTI